MRVATNTFSNNLVLQLNMLQDRQNRLQNQAATGQKITNPEDDPAAVRRTMDLQAQSRANTQYQSNIATLQETASSTYTVISGLQKISNRAGEIATLADGLKTQKDLAPYASELRDMIKQAVQLVNSKDRGNYLLSGTKTDTQPYAATTDANGYISSVTYQGNSNVNEVEIAEGNTISAQTVGENTTGAGPAGLITDSRSGADFLNHLISLQNHLLAGDTDSIASTDRGNLATDEDNILAHVADNGSLQSRLQASDGLSSQWNLSLDTQITNLTGADLATVLTQLSQAQNAYRAAIQSGAQLMNTSLMDYLH